MRQLGMEDRNGKEFQEFDIVEYNGSEYQILGVNKLQGYFMVRLNDGEWFRFNPRNLDYNDITIIKREKGPIVSTSHIDKNLRHFESKVEEAKMDTAMKVKNYLISMLKAKKAYTSGSNPYSGQQHLAVLLSPTQFKKLPSVLKNIGFEEYKNPYKQNWVATYKSIYDDDLRVEFNREGKDDSIMGSSIPIDIYGPKKAKRSTLPQYDSVEYQKDNIMNKLKEGTRAVLAIQNQDSSYEIGYMNQYGDYPMDSMKRMVKSGVLQRNPKKLFRFLNDTYPSDKETWNVSKRMLIKNYIEVSDYAYVYFPFINSIDIYQHGNLIQTIQEKVNNDTSTIIEIKKPVKVGDVILEVGDTIRILEATRPSSVDAIKQFMIKEKRL